MSRKSYLISTWNLLLKSLLVLLGLRVAVEVEIDHDIPLGLAVGNGATETEDLTGQHPPNQTNGVTSLVVGWDGYVDELGWGVGVAEGDNGNVDIGSLLDSLSIGAGVGHDDEAGLLERAGDVVGEVTWGETTGDGDSSSVVGKLQDSTLTVGTSRDDTDVGWVVDSCDDAGREDDLLPARAKSVFVPQGRKASGAARSGLQTYQVLPMLITLIPSGRVFQR